MLSSNQLTVTDLSFCYATSVTTRLPELPVPVLQNVSWQLSSGELLHIQGQNGAGKTTLLHCLAGILRPTSGVIQYGGDDIQRWLSHYQQHVCYVGHKPGISTALTVLDNCLYDLKIQQPRDILDDRLREAGLWELRHTACALLSAGQKRRVALVRLGLSAARLWLLDEPLVALDTESVTLLLHWLQAHVLAGGQVVYSSHQPLPKLDVCHRTYRLC